MLNPCENNKRPVAVYARVSTSNQENEGTIETQLLAISDFAEKNNLHIVQKYLDNGWSGDQLARPALDQMRMDARAKKWEAVLMYDPDRLARRYSFQELVMDELKELGVDPLFVTIPPSKSIEDNLLYGVRGVFAEYERVKITERFRLGKVRKAKAGHVILTEAPFGYTFIPRRGKPGDLNFKQGCLRINQREAEIVKNIFQWVADQGLSQRNIVKRLYDQGIQPRKSARGVWATSTLSTLLRNTTYIGTAYFGKSRPVVAKRPLKDVKYKKQKKTSRILRPKSEWIAIKVLPIIDEELFDKVQRQLKINIKRSPRSTKNQYLLQDKIFCFCGTRRTCEGHSDRRNRYYRCINRVLRFPLPKSCPESGLNVKQTDEKVWNALVSLLKTPVLLDQQILRYLNARKDQHQNRPNGKNDLTARKSKLLKQEQRYAEAFGHEVIDLEQLRVLVEPIKKEIALVESQFNEIQQENAAANEPKLPTQEQLKQLVVNTDGLAGIYDFATKKNIVASLVEKILAAKDKMTIKGIIPSSYFNQENVKLCSNSRNSLNTNQSLEPKVGIPFEITIKGKDIKQLT